jgi:hypothetical protein
MAEATGFELAASCVTDKRSDQLNFAPITDSLALRCAPCVRTGLLGRTYVCWIRRVVADAGQEPICNGGPRILDHLVETSGRARDRGALEPPQG